MTAGWPDDWEDRKAGRDCPMCATTGRGDNDHTVSVAELPYADVGLERRSRLPGSRYVYYKPCTSAVCPAAVDQSCMVGGPCSVDCSRVASCQSTHAPSRRANN